MKNNNRFVFIIPFYNVKDYILDCVNSILAQKYENWLAIFCDDLSSDGTSDLIPTHDKFIKRISVERGTALKNIHDNLINSDFLLDEDIIVILDGDDFLINSQALDVLDAIYNINKPLITYGQYVYMNGQIGHCYGYSREEFTRLRELDWRASHLRTFKWKVYKEIQVQDPNYLCYKDANGEFYKSCYDVAIMHPLLEIAGYDRVYFNQIPLYYYRIHQNNDHNLNAALQKGIELEIRGKQKFKQVLQW